MLPSWTAATRSGFTAGPKEIRVIKINWMSHSSTWHEI
jgi:hypothetical protein